MPPHAISGINRLPAAQKRAIYTRLIPPDLFVIYKLKSNLHDSSGNDLLHLNCEPDSALAEMALYHQAGFPDPVLYGQITDTANGYLHVLLYILNDPNSPRFDIDCLPDGTSTGFGTHYRNLEAELAAMQYGLAPGQVRDGLGLLGSAIQAFEQFVTSLGQELYFVESLHYHNAIIFENYGFAYEKGRRLMERIQAGFAPGGELTARLDNSTPFRSPQAANSIRLRSWALHDNLLGEPFTGITMYKKVGKPADVNTSTGCPW